MRECTVGLTVLLLVALIGGAIAGGVTADSDDHEGEMSVVGAIETPTESLEILGSEYEVNEIAVVEQGDSIDIQVGSSERYDVVLYNTDEQSEGAERKVSSDTTTVTLGDDEDDLETNDLAPGTYMLSLEQVFEGRVAVTPVVVQGYDIQLDYPTAVESGSDIDLEATVESTAGLEQPDSLEVAIWDGSEVRETTLQQEDGTTYATTLSGSSFDGGDYSVYGTVLSDETVHGYQMSLAVAEGPSITVSEPDDGTDESDTDDDSNEIDETDGETEQPVSDDTDETNESSDDEQSDVIEPNETDSSGADDVADDDGLGTSSVLTSIVALAVGGTLIAARKRL